MPRVARAASARQKRSNSRAMSASPTPIPSSAAFRTVAPGSRVDRERERGAVARVADRVLGQVLGDDPQHPRPQRQVDARRRRRRRSVEPGARGARLELVDHLLEHRQGVRAAERDDLGAALELGEEEDLVDQRAGVVDLGARLLEQRVDVGAGQVGRVEQHEDPGERRAQLVRDRCREAGPQLVERDVLDDRLGHRHGHRHLVARFGLAGPLPFCETAPSPDRHHFDTCSVPQHGTMVGAWGRS